MAATRHKTGVFLLYGLHITVCMARVKPFKPNLSTVKPTFGHEDFRAALKPCSTFLRLTNSASVAVPLKTHAEALTLPGGGMS